MRHPLCLFVPKKCATQMRHLATISLTTMSAKHEFVEIFKDGKLYSRIHLPKKPACSLEEYRRACCQHREKDILDVDFWPCLYCCADGWVYDSEDPPCPVEGNKMRRRLKCPRCEGSRQSDRRTIAAAYRDAISNWNYAREKAQKTIRILCDTLRNLSTEQTALLIRYLGNLEDTQYYTDFETTVIDLSESENVTS